MPSWPTTALNSASIEQLASRLSCLRTRPSRSQSAGGPLLSRVTTRDDQSTMGGEGGHPHFPGARKWVAPSARKCGMRNSERGMGKEKWQMTNAGWQMTNAGWQMTNAGWQMTNAGWQMTNAGWRMTNAGWRMTNEGEGKGVI